MAATARVLEEAAVVIEEVRSQLRRQPDCSEKRTSLEACFDALNASLTDVPLEELGIEKRVSSTILDAVEEFELATGRASRIVSKISKHPFLLTGKPRPSPDEDSTSAEILHRELIARIEQECRATQAAMDSDVEEMRQERLQIEGELKKQTAELTAAHRRNLCSAQESFNLAMQQIQGTKDHGLCLLRLKSLESRGNQTIQRLEAEIKAARREIAKARKLVSTQDKETLLSSYRTRATALRLRKQDERNAPGNRRGNSSGKKMKSDLVPRIAISSGLLRESNSKRIFRASRHSLTSTGVEGQKDAWFLVVLSSCPEVLNCMRNSLPCHLYCAGM